MGKFFTVLVVGIAFFIGAFYFLNQETARKSGKTILTKGTINFGTQEFAGGMPIPKKFTCEGKNVNPTLYIERVPEFTKSLVIILDDPDAAPKTFTHWIMFNIPPSETLIEEREIPMGSKIATNDAGKQEYFGPCPPIGTHKYFYRIYALDTVLSLDENAKRADFDREMKGHIITTGETWGEFSK